MFSSRAAGKALKGQGTGTGEDVLLGMARSTPPAAGACHREELPDATHLKTKGDGDEVWKRGVRCLEVADTQNSLMGPSPSSLCVSAGSCPAPPFPAACANGWKMSFAAGCVLVPPRWDTGKGAGLGAGLPVWLLRASFASATCPANTSQAVVTL